MFIPVENLSLIHLAHFAQESSSPSSSSNSHLEILPEEETIGETHVLFITWTCSYILSRSLHWNPLSGSLKCRYLASTQYLQNPNIQIWSVRNLHFSHANIWYFLRIIEFENHLHTGHVIWFKYEECGPLWFLLTAQSHCEAEVISLRGSSFALMVRTTKFTFRLRVNKLGIKLQLFHWSALWISLHFSESLFLHLRRSDDYPSSI